MSINALKWAAVFTLLLPATVSAQDPMAIAEGAQVYLNSCSRCHNARASSERTDAEWLAIVLHMRARANFTKSQAGAVLAFLQATNLPEATSGMASAGMMLVPPALHVAPTTTEALEAIAAEPVRRPGGD